MNCIHKFFAIIMAGFIACSVQAMDNHFSKISDDQLQELIITAYQELKELDSLPDELSACYQNIMQGIPVERSELERMSSLLASDALRACYGTSCGKLSCMLNLLCEINEDITGIFTVIDNISITLTGDIMIGAIVDLSGVFTALAFGFYDTQTIICQKFEQTWTILQKIDDDVMGVFTAINALEDFSGIFTALEFGFYDTQTIICEKFEQTWTILAPVVVALCSPQEILQANIGVTTYTISQPGFYVFAENIVFSPASGQPALEITTDNVTIDMCGKTLTQGNAIAGVDGIRIPGNTTAAPRSNVTIMNGGISGFSRSGIVVGTNPITPANTAARLISIKNMKIFSCSSIGVEFVSGSSIAQATLENLELFSNLIGASLTNVVDSSIKSCDMILNTTGIRLNLSSDITVEKCKAHKNTQAGFWLQNASNNTLTQCFATNNGQGGNTDAYGFIAQGGYANVFEECIAQGTFSNATGDDNVAAGFALTSTEMFSKIINCESLTNTTVSGFATPYGILLTNTLPETGLTLAFSATDIFGLFHLAWTPDGKYLAATPNAGAIYLNEFDPREGLFLVATQSTINGVAFGFAWSPDERFFALLNGGSTNLDLYSFDQETKFLTFLNTTLVPPMASTLAWSPNGQYLLVGYPLTGGGGGGFDYTIYIFTGGALGGPIGLFLDRTFGAGVNSVDWLDNETYAVGGPVTGGGYSIGVYSFNPAFQLPLGDKFLTLLLTTASPGVAINRVKWSPDKRYLAAIDAGGGLFVYTFDGTTLGTTPATATVSAVANDFDWSPDGKYIAVAHDQGLDVYRFSRSLFSLSLQDTLSTGSQSLAVAWSPTGEFLALPILQGFPSTPVNTLNIYNALEFTATKNIIKNNVVYGNNGNSLPSGLGISGSSFSNLIIGNTAYNNQF
ncbi:MAG: right-handed parallel beta-helix repeat-containing protein, partial [Candidatus Babeliales bacterium]